MSITPRPSNILLPREVPPPFLAGLGEYGNLIAAQEAANENTVSKITPSLERSVKINFIIDFLEREQENIYILYNKIRPAYSENNIKEFVNAYIRAYQPQLKLTPSQQEILRKKIMKLLSTTSTAGGRRKTIRRRANRRTRKR